jgi:hypothetical protein
MSLSVQRPGTVAGLPKRISTKYSSSLKFIPLVCFGFLGFLFVLMVMNGAFQKAPMFLVLLGVMSIMVYHWWKTAIRDLADEVDDCGDFLVVRKGGDEDTVLLSNIINVNFSADRRGAAPRIKLTLAAPGKFGSEIAFAPPAQFFAPSGRNAIAEDLLARAYKARSDQAV